MNYFGNYQENHFDKMSQDVKEFKEKIKLTFSSKLEELIEPWDISARKQLIAEMDLKKHFYGEDF